jgi:hypothetical protein
MKTACALTLAIPAAFLASILPKQDSSGSKPYTCLESTVIVRGDATLTSGSAVIDLGPDFEKNMKAEGRSIQLTCKDTGSILWASSVKDGKFTVQTDGNGNPAQAFWWQVAASHVPNTVPR